MTYSPETYWNISDKRQEILKKYLKVLPFDSKTLLPVEEIIKGCIETLKTFTLNVQEKLDLKQLILLQNSEILTPCVDEICKKISTFDAVTLISLGCGDEGLFEHQLSEAMSMKYPKTKISWLAVDIEDFRGAKSFFNGKPFTVIDGGQDTIYASLVPNAINPILIGRYSYHHTGITFESFMKRCEGLSHVFLIEEPTTSILWNIPEYRIMRIAYDILANTVFSENWAEAFMKDPSKFKISYIQTDTLPPSCTVVGFKDMLPETALVYF